MKLGTSSQSIPSKDDPDHSRVIKQLCLIQFYFFRIDDNPNLYSNSRYRFEHGGLFVVVSPTVTTYFDINEHGTFLENILISWNQ